MKKSLVLWLLGVLPLCLLGQQVEMLNQTYSQVENILSPEDEAMLKACPVLKLNAQQLARPLPSEVDNSLLPYMTPIYSQSALECGQASSIVYTFSYEINCRRGTNNDNFNRRYPTHFAWNFCNGGSSAGVSFMDTWEVIRTAGTPNVSDWGGWYSTGGPSRWASGYNLYYKAMQNRIVEFLAIPTDSEDGLLTLKHWIDNHLCGDEHGGLANFYSTHVPNGNEEMLRQIPEGTPHAGMWIVPNFKTNVNHGQTIVGYDDSICWDYNGDGMYTNDRDLNSDGVVDIRDWEVGAVIFCNSFGTGFANQGYCYLPYRKLAELPANGGIWNKCVYVVNVKDPVSPRLTYKVTLDHTCRNKIKLQAGVSTNLSATQPDHTIDWAVFNYQGGEHYMQGDSTDEQRMLELGLDVSRLLEFIEPGQSAKFFLQVIEDDPNGTADGQVVSFALLDYNGSILPVQTVCSDANVPLVNNGTTTLSVVSSIDFTRPQMQPAPPVMEAFTDYQYQIPVTGGNAPYRFEFTKEYTIEEFSASMPTATGANISLSNTNTGYALVDLPFDFPYYDEKYSQLCIYADGYMSFRYDTYNWPFLKDPEKQIKATQMIAPFRADLVVTSVKKSQTSSEVTIFVQAKIDGQSSSNVSYAVKLYPDGVIEFYYGSMGYTGNGGLSLISRGDTRIYQKTPVSEGTAAQFANRCFRFTPPQRVDFLQLSRDGVLSGMSETAFTHLPVPVTCFDINDQRHDTLVYISCEYGNMLIITDLHVDAGGDEVITAGEEVTLSFTVRNLDTVPYADCFVRFSTPCPYVEMIDDNEYFGYIGGGNAYTLNHAIRFRTTPGTPNMTIADFVVTISNDHYPMTTVMPFTIYSNWLEVVSYAVLDGGNHRVDANETDTLQVWFKNAGAETLTDLMFEMRIQEEHISLLDIRDDFYLMEPDEIKMAEFIFHPDAQYQTLSALDVLIDVYSGLQYSDTKVITLIGESNCVSFESGLPEGFSYANYAWYSTSDEAADGVFSLCSGDITHNDTSTLICQFTAVREGTVSFSYKTSTENNYDWLYFFIDGTQQMRWSGVHDWERYEAPILAGEHTLVWKYIKDYSVDGNADKVWIDDVCFPLENDAMPELQISPNVVEVTAGVEQMDIPLLYESVTPIYLLYENRIVNEDMQPIGWASIESPGGSLNALASREVNLSLRLAGMPDGVYHANLVATVQEGNTVQVPITVVAVNTGVDEYAVSEGTVKVYPNPTSGSVTVEQQGFDGQQVQCRLFDMSGRQLRWFEENNSQFEVDLGDVAQGMYFLQMRWNSGEVQVVKIVKR